jgi:hypothetical protein
MVYLMSQIGEIGSNSFTHTTNKDSSNNTWYYEIEKSKELIETYSLFTGVKLSRAPKLGYSDNYFRNLLLN